VGAGDSVCGRDPPGRARLIARLIWALVLLSWLLAYRAGQIIAKPWSSMRSKSVGMWRR